MPSKPRRSNACAHPCACGRVRRIYGVGTQDRTINAKLSKPQRYLPRTTVVPRTEPFPHQWAALEASYHKRSFALVMDPGLGKSKVVLDTATSLFLNQHITGLCVLAPNDVHAQWVNEQIPAHLPRIVWVRSVIWDAGRAKIQKEALELCKPIKGLLHVFAVNHEALATDRGRSIVRRFLKAHPSLLVLDESHEFRTPKAKRTRALGSLAPLAFARRILTGTLTGGSPFHLYSQFNFLDPRILNCNSYLTFKHRYAEWAEQMVLSKKVDPKTGKRKPQVYEELVEYKGLDELHDLIKPFVFSVKKKDVEGLPPKLYETVPTHLSAAQVDIYNQLFENGLTLLEQAEAGHSPVQVLELEELEEEDILSRVTNPRDRMSYRIKLTMWLRLQQCTAGIVKDDAGRVSVIDGSWDKCPRMQTALTWVTNALQTGSKVIVWANFRPVLEALHGLLGAALPTLLVHGGITGEARVKAIAAFKDPQGPKVLVAHPRTLGTGQNFEVASYVLYYTRSFSYFQRVQSEDRAHRLSSRGTVTIGDVVASNSGTDEKELLNLRSKLDVVSQLETFDMRKLGHHDPR